MFAEVAAGQRLAGELIAEGRAEARAEDRAADAAPRRRGGWDPPRRADADGRAGRLELLALLHDEAGSQAPSLHAPCLYVYHPHDGAPEHHAGRRTG